MEQFSLEKYLENPSRKVVTRDGRPVRIICWDKKDSEYPIVGLVSNENGLKAKEGCCSFTIDGKAWGESYYDLFFADEEEELTEFEKELEKFRTHILATSGEKYDKNGECVIKKVSKNLLDLARKELLKDLPKWKRDSNNLSSLIYTLDNRGDGRIFLCRKGYAININELLNLPKEE